MHELSVAGSILRIVEDAARKQAFSRVRSLHLSVPVLAGIEVDALRFALRSLAPSTLLAGAEVVVDEPATPARCILCDHRADVGSHDEACPRCGDSLWQATGAAELRVVDLLVD